MPPRISVVVPVYNVEPYLAECLESLAGQTVRDLEVIMVDDGSKDRSGEIAQGFADRDERFRLVTQPNGGLGNARNNGIKHATGEFLAFVDSDDYLAPNAYELLLGALDETGSDFATGNVLRLQSIGAKQVHFLAEAFNKTRLATHVSKYPPLIADRVAWNKLFRRSFWDAQGRTFPEGVLNEDIPVILPAHFAAKSVDVIADPIYYWRIRDGEELSITQRRLEPKALHDRMAALEKVVDWLDQNGKKKWKRWYLEGVVSDDLRFYLNPLVQADDEYRQLFLDKVNAFLDRAPKGIFDKQSSIERLKWHLVRRRLMPELLEVIRFQKGDQFRETAPVQIDGRWYGDYPFREDERLKIPKSVYLLEGELGLRAEIESLDWEDGRLKVRGYAYIRGIGAAEPDTQKLSVVVLRRGRLKRVRIRLTAKKLDVTPVRRPDVTGGLTQRLRNLDWSGFEATLDPRDLRTAGRWRPGTWELFVIVRSGKTHRRRGRFNFNKLRPVRGIELGNTPPDVLAKAVPLAGGGVAIEVRTEWTTVRDHRVVDGDVLELSGELRGSLGEKPRLEVVRRGDEKKFKYPIEVDGDSFTTRIKLKQILKAGKTADAEEAEAEEQGDAEEQEDPEQADDRQGWDLQTSSAGERATVGLPREAAARVWSGNGRELWLSRTRKADAALIDQTPRPIVREAEWTADGRLVLGGGLPEGLAPQELVLVAGDYGDTFAFPMTSQDDRFDVSISPARVESLAGTLPLRTGNWGLFMREAGAGETAPRMPVVIAHGLYDRLPLRTVVDRKPFALGMTKYDRAFIAVERDLEEDERGHYNQLRLRETVYVARRTQPLKDAVIYTSFHGRQYSDSPRAIHEELVRRGTPLEHLWVVQDGQCEVPPSATVVRDGSREHHDALATARYVVTNDHFPDWFARRPDQLCLQTWHGAPLKRLGFDVTARRSQGNRFTRWDQQVLNWQYVLSPNRFSTPILKRAYAVEGEMLETGYPRDDVLAGADRDARTQELRRKLGIPDGKRTVLYAPTYRDHVFDARGRYRLDLHLDLERLRAAVGEDTVILFRKHHYIVDPVPTDTHGFVRDVSRYPDGTELMLAADVLVTDYSSMMFDYANTGRPMLFFTYDLDAYADEIRGFYVDFTEIVPGPLLRTTEDVAEALRDIDGVQAAHAQRYDQFARRFCELDDGQASARVVDRLFET
jgi:CDP-glycerol glycerophosphotransferase